MNLLRRIGIGLGVFGFAVATGAVLLFNRPTWGWQALSIPTGSMRPSMPPGSLALVHRVPDSSLKVGDIITYTNPLNPQGTVTHRIIRSYKLDGRVPAYITKGDANKSPDTPVVAGLVQGKLIGHVPYVGAWLMWAKTWVGVAVLVYVPALLIMIEEVRRLGAYYRLAMPYRLYPLQRRSLVSRKVKYAASAMAATLVVLGGVVGPSALALLASDTVALTPNNISVSTSTPPGSCTGTTTNTTDVNVNNSSTQTAASGNANGSSATSGAASNDNSTAVTISIRNGC